MVREGTAMKLINTDGMALIGPGSEWLWTTVAGVVAVVTLLAIYRQLRMQRGAAAIGQMNALQAEWVSSEAIARARLAFLIALRDGTELGIDPLLRLTNFSERIGYLVRMGHFDRRLVWEYFGGTLQDWYGWVEPVAKRRNLGEPEHWKWLVGVLDDMDRKAGRAIVRDELYYAQRFPFSMESNLQLIQLAEELRSVIVRPKSTRDRHPGTKTRRCQPAAS
jgi:hypothetical protein